MKKLSVFEKIQQVIDAKNITPSRAEQLCGFGVGTIAKLIERKGKEAKINSPMFWKVVRKGQLIETLYEKWELITSHTAIKTFILQAGQRWGLRVEEIAAITGKDVKTILGYYLEPDIQSAKLKMIEAENRAQMKVV